MVFIEVEAEWKGSEVTEKMSFRHGDFRTLIKRLFSKLQNI